MQVSNDKSKTCRINHTNSAQKNITALKKPCTENDQVKDSWEDESIIEDQSNKIEVDDGQEPNKKGQ